MLLLTSYSLLLTPMTILQVETTQIPVKETVLDKFASLRRPIHLSLPTMYDLPSESIGDPGLPDQFHILQPNLLEETFCPPDYPIEQILVATDLNLYYDEQHLQWYKRPDWYVVVGVPRLHHGQDLWSSYVIWQEGMAPFIVVELLSPGTEKEDLGETEPVAGEPPTKWQVYEQILGVPYYVVYSRRTNKMRAFELVNGRYVELHLPRKRLWLPTLNIGLGVWKGTYHGIAHQWLRWYDDNGEWILTPVEREQQRVRYEQQQVKLAQQRTEQERHRADYERRQAQRQLEQAQRQTEQAQRQTEQAQRKAEQLAAKLRELGIDPESL